MEYHSFFITTFLLAMALMYVYNKNCDLNYVVSTFNGKGYMVRDKHDNIEAANLLAKISENLINLCDHLNREFSNDERIKRLISKFNPDSIIETEKGSRYTSYSVNKGEKIVLCLRTRDEDEKLIDENTLMFVSLHELAHIMTESIGHKSDFWDNFKFLLKHAIKLQIYKYVDYNSQPQKYCGILITDTPLNGNS